MELFLMFLIFCCSPHLFAQDSAQLKSPWSHESEAAVVKVNGNTASESYSAKQKTIYKVDSNSLAIAGSYLQSKALGTETAKAWDVSLRYEKALSEIWSAFIQQGSESNTYAGYLQRDNTDVGGKYTFIKSETENAFLEAGARSTKTLSSQGFATKTENFGRLYTEYTRKINASVSAKAWVEYLPNFTDSEAYLLNYEPSLSVLMNRIFSLKIAYLVKFHNKILVATEQKEDTTFTTSLVAKF